MEEEKQSYGKLKIFFGYAAGVGKTYAMLKAAQKLAKQGADVVIGYLEPHDRPQTTKMSEGLERIDTKEYSYKGICLQDMDVDAIIKRKPHTVLVDEYAHTNPPGGRHQKRYQDVEELLKAGIHVYTTVNVQHIESLCDIIASITGIFVQERIPDSAFDRADEVQIVDIEPEDLLHRLQEGKIYQPNQAGRAMQNFFTLDKLTALREIALRRMADRVNLITEQNKKKTGREFFTEEKILVGISSAPSNPKIIRTAARMAMAFGGELIGLHVESESGSKRPEDVKRLKDNIHLAEQLGAKIDTICGDDIPLLLAEYAKNSGISKIVTGRSNNAGGLFRRNSFTDRLSMYAPNLDIYIIPDHDLKRNYRRFHFNTEEKITGRQCIYALLSIIIASTVGFLFYEIGFSEANIITVYILGGMISAIVTSSRLISFVQSVISVLCFNFFFTEPRFSLDTYDNGYPATFVITFIAALITSNLALKMKKQTKEIAKSAYRMKVILDINQMLQTKKNMDEIGKTMAEQLYKVLGNNIVYYGAKGDSLKAPVTCGIPIGSPTLSENERAVAEWVYKNNKRAGVTTGTLNDARCYYLAVRGSQAVYGVVGIEMKKEEALSAFDNTVLMAILSETGTVMEREMLKIKENQAIEQANSEKLKANLLRSISHDLRTPLTSICGNADMLLQSKLSDEKRMELYSYIYEDSLWLINLVENLLAVTKIENGNVKLKMQAEMLEELIEEALKHVTRKREQYQIQVSMEDELQFVRVDSGLILQVLINLVDNAIKYTPAGSMIFIETRKEQEWVHVRVKDNGYGISKEDQEHIFEMFYTAGQVVADSQRSLGLGLSLCKSIVQAHGGKICVYDNFPKGAVFDFTIPAEEVTIHE